MKIKNEKCKHCINEANPYMDGFCVRCWELQFENEITLKLSKDELNYISELILKESLKSKEPYKSNLKVLSDKFYKKLKGQ